MRIKTILMLICFLSVFSVSAEVTIEQCVEKATANYPLIKKYNLISTISGIELSDIQKGWLPRVDTYAQVTGQNAVPSFPEALSGVLQSMGQEMKGLGKVQYKVGVDASQKIWDGDRTKARRDMVRAQEAVEHAALDVELYQIRQRVENLYFAILLAETQIGQARITHKLLTDNLDRLRAMYRNGVAMQSDIDMVEAQALTVNQSIIQAQTAADSYRRALELFLGESLENETLAMPAGEIPLDKEPLRPELKLLERRIELNDAAQRFADSSLMPTVGAFVQAYYGYPGFNYFNSMINRRLSFNILAGVKVAWNLDSFYTKNNRQKRTALTAEEIAADKDVFLLNTRIQSASQTETIKGIKTLMEDDARISELRQKVRKAAESQLANGVIDITALLAKISDENMALLTSKYHEIMLMQEIYKLKYTLDR